MGRRKSTVEAEVDKLETQVKKPKVQERIMKRIARPRSAVRLDPDDKNQLTQGCFTDSIFSKIFIFKK